MQQLAPHIVAPTAISSTRFYYKSVQSSKVANNTTFDGTWATVDPSDSGASSYRVHRFYFESVQISHTHGTAINRICSRVGTSDCGTYGNHINRLEFVSNSSGGSYTVLSKDLQPHLFSITCIPIFNISIQE